MWDKFRAFNIEYHTEISWFFIGLFTLSFLYSIGRGDWVSGAIDALLVWVNYWLYKNDIR